MAKTAKKAAKPAVKKQANRRTIEDRLDFIEGMIAAITYVILNAEIEIVQKPAKKARK